MKRYFIILMVVCALVFTGCATQDEDILKRLDEMEQRIAVLEQNAVDITTPEQQDAEPLPEFTPEPEATEEPADDLGVTIDEFLNTIPDGFIHIMDENTIVEAALLKEYNQYGFTIRYATASVFSQNDIRAYAARVLGDESAANDVDVTQFAVFMSPDGDSYFVAGETDDDFQNSALMEVQFSEADFSDIMDVPGMDISKYYLDEIFSMPPTMEKLIIRNNSTANSYYFEYKYEDTDYDEIINQIYAGHNIKRIAEDENQLIYTMADGAEAIFFRYQDSNRVDVYINY